MRSERGRTFANMQTGKHGIYPLELLRGAGRTISSRPAHGPLLESRKFQLWIHLKRFQFTCFFRSVFENESLDRCGTANQQRLFFTSCMYGGSRTDAREICEPCLQTKLQ